ncbi:MULTISPECIES: nickel-dependent lactate racemase [Enterocloster]|uniref:Nickel-dependent lactate racemase n=1 Tax=Enterocloster lavalensis TaxID=460384 RepID=A0A1I0CQ56_9FIRM|nr:MULTISPECIES: nickel-dependent lactate racemase [Enterocloster]MDR3755551.1 nickel-dependent lactate racemase [Enterocloster sp.]PST31485.1 nickel-dependent lactate racemase [Enterocloster lavalensis]SET21187.1 Nickel-dependent lactate racemase [Enterocloster lavalensis]
MKRIRLPYGEGVMTAEIPEERLLGVLEGELNDFRPEGRQEELVRWALEQPVGTPRLRDMARGKRRIVVIASDHTRPVPSRVMMPLMLEELRAGNPAADITILIATGCHREPSRDELIRKFGPEIVEREKIVAHDCGRVDQLTALGTLPSGGELLVNRMAVEADLLCAEGFIEPHFFAGFSGGRKSVLPGIAGRETVLWNHCAEFIHSPEARTGRVDRNPMHRDMLYAARAVGLDFILNVVLNSRKEIVFAVAGECDLAHIRGRDFLSGRCRVKAVPAPIVISTNGGYPLDQNIYQAVKGMTAAESTVEPGGVIIMLAQCGDGHGGQTFYDTLSRERDISELMKKILATPPGQTVPDQWQFQIFARVIMGARVILVSDAPDEMTEALHMIPAHSVAEALETAGRLLGRADAGVTVIPDGVSVIVE